MPVSMVTFLLGENSDAIFWMRNSNNEIKTTPLPVL